MELLVRSSPYQNLQLLYLNLGPDICLYFRNHFHGGVSAKILEQTADLFVSLGLKDLGYEFVNTDDGKWGIDNYKALSHSKCVSCIVLFTYFHCVPGIQFAGM